MATVNKADSIECNIVRRRVWCVAAAAGPSTMSHTAGSDAFDQRLPFVHQTYVSRTLYASIHNCRVI